MMTNLQTSMVAVGAMLLVFIAHTSFVNAQAEGDAPADGTSQASSASVSTFSFHEQYRPCLPEPDCPPAEVLWFYRADGSCNNPLDGSIGQAGRAHKRLVPAAYADGRDEPRQNSAGNKLPSPRKVSADMQDTGTPKSTLHTHSMVIWGQFLAHDLTLTPVVIEEDLDCSVCGTRNSACINIDLPSRDPIRGEEDRKCLPLVRSQPVPDSQCSAAIRQQANDLTPYIDGGTLYGNSVDKFTDLLDYESDIGKLKTGKLEPFGHSPPNAPSLPLETQVNFKLHAEDCPVHIHKPMNVTCFVAGDDRVNENTALASFHTLFVRFHNNLVEKLHVINPEWTRELLIHNARLIVSAVTQRITYNEFLPEILGSDYMKRFDLDLIDEGYWHGYDASFDATTSNAFATAAMRFGHTLLTSPLTRPDDNYVQPQGEPLELKELFFNSVPLLTTEEGGANSFLRGLTNDPIEIVDTTFVQDIHNFLFAETGKYGEDLLSRNIQRGRDHGLPGYNAYREFCGLKKAKFFRDFIEIPFTPRKRLQKIYSRKVDDVDLYIAGIAESPVAGGLFGPTFSCILGYQYRDIRKGDRLWHENGGERAVFTSDQLQAIRQFDLSRLLCELDDMVSVQPKPFRLHTLNGNNRQLCEPDVGMNLTAWKLPFENHLIKTQEFGSEMTPWFPSIYTTNTFTSSERLLSYLLQIRPDDVCENPLDVEERTIRGNKQYRYSCPPGSIRGTDYPNADASKGAWTSWEKYSVPISPAFGDAVNEPPSSCLQPIAVQVINDKGIPARQTEDVFSTFSASAGFACRGNDQPIGRCYDYQVRYFCKAVKSDTTESASK